MSDLKTAHNSNQEEVAKDLSEKEEQILHNVTSKDKRMRAIVEELSTSPMNIDQYRTDIQTLRDRQIDTYNGWNWNFIEQLKPEMYKQMLIHERITLEEIPQPYKSEIETELEENKDFKSTVLANQI